MIFLFRGCHRLFRLTFSNYVWSLTIQNVVLVFCHFWEGMWLVSFPNSHFTRSKNVLGGITIISSHGLILEWLYASSDLPVQVAMFTHLKQMRGPFSTCRSSEKRPTTVQCFHASLHIWHYTLQPDPLRVSQWLWWSSAKILAQCHHPGSYLPKKQ